MIEPQKSSLRRTDKGQPLLAQAGLIALIDSIISCFFSKNSKREPVAMNGPLSPEAEPKLLSMLL